MKAGFERDKAALLVVIGALRDGTKELLAVTSGYRESTESWSAVFRDLKARGIEAPRLVAVAYAPTRAKALGARKAFAKRFGPWYPKAVEVLEDD